MKMLFLPLVEKRCFGYNVSAVGTLITDLCFKLLESLKDGTASNIIHSFCPNYENMFLLIS